MQEFNVGDKVRVKKQDHSAWGLVLTIVEKWDNNYYRVDNDHYLTWGFSNSALAEDYWELADPEKTLSEIASSLDELSNMFIL